MASYIDEVDRIADHDTRAIDIIGGSLPSERSKPHIPETHLDNNDDFIDVNQNVSQPKTTVKQEWAIIDHPYLWKQNEQLHNLALENIESGELNSENCSTLLLLTRSFSDKDIKHCCVELSINNNPYIKLDRCYSDGCINDENSEHNCILACKKVPLNVFPMLKNNAHSIQIRLKIKLPN